MKYMAPEQLRDDSATMATDMYSFGLIAFELLTGDFPGIGESLADYLVNIDTVYSDIIVKCLSKRPDLRPQSGQAVLKLLAVYETAPLTENNDGQEVSNTQRLVRSTFSFLNLQVGATVKVDGQPLDYGTDYTCEIKSNKSATFDIQVSWEGLDLFRGPLLLKAGETRRVEVPNGYRVDCEVPSWCQVSDADNRPITFPLIGFLTVPSDVRTFSLLHNEVKFGSLEIEFNTVNSTVVVPYKLASVIVECSLGNASISLTGSDGQNLSYSSSSPNHYIIPIKIGETMDVVLRCYDKLNIETFASTIQLRSGKEHLVKVPEGASPSSGTIQDPLLTLGEPSRTWNFGLLNAVPKSRRVLLAAGIGAAVGGGWYAVKLMQRSIRRSTPTMTPSPTQEEEALLHDKMVKAADKCHDQFPELSKYLRMMRVIPAGTFIQGLDRVSKYSPRDEWPSRSVALSTFGLGETPVTVSVWKEYCSTGLGRFPEVKNWKWSRLHPVVSVSWDQIMGFDGQNGFCAWASEVSGIRLTLPTEAQFEYAARGGRYQTKFPWGNDFDDTKLWCSVVKQRGLTAPVNRNTHVYRNGYGLTDMVGNVWQWCYDVYSPYSRDEQVNPIGPSVTKDRQRCMRGGSWVSEDLHVFTPTDRLPKPPNTKYSGCGFRIATNLM
jgi:sulfatase modifying factor 1